MENVDRVDALLNPKDFFHESVFAEDEADDNDYGHVDKSDNDDEPPNHIPESQEPRAMSTNPMLGIVGSLRIWPTEQGWRMLSRTRRLRRKSRTRLGEGC